MVKQFEAALQDETNVVERELKDKASFKLPVGSVVNECTLVVKRPYLDKFRLCVDPRGAIIATLDHS